MIRNFPTVGFVACLIFFNACQNSNTPQQQRLVEQDSISDADCQPTASSNVAETVAPTSNASLQQFLKQLQSKPTSFLISSENDTIVKGANGIHCMIPQDAFADQKGHGITGEVLFKMTECTSMASFIGHQLTTVCDDQLIETAGMVYLEAFANGKALQLADGKELQLFFPKQSTDFQNMQTFYGSARADGAVEWDEAKDVTNFGQDGIGIADWWANQDTVQTGQPSVANTPQRNSMRGYRINLAGHTASMNHQPVLWAFKDSNVTIFERFPEEFNLATDLNLDSLYDTLEAADRNRLLVQMKLTPQGKLYGFKVKKSLHHDIDRAVIDYLKLLPELDLAQMRFMSKDGSYALVFAIQKFNDQFWYADEFREQYSAYNHRLMEQVSQLEVTNYVVASRELGWINCDRFPEDQPLLDFVVIPMTENESSVHLVFKGMNAIMKGIETEDGFVFKNVPDRANASVVGITTDGDGPALAILPLKISDRTVHLENYERFTLAQLDKAIAPLSQPPTN